MTELQRQLMQNAKPGESERTRRMALLEAYYANEQYAHLPRAWDEDLDPQTGAVIPFRSRRPSTVPPLASLIVDTFTRSLWSQGRRPLAVIKDGDSAPLADLIAEAKLYRVMREATRRALTVGSGVVVWKILDSSHYAEAWDAKWCSPTFKPGCFPELDALECKYPFTVEENGRQITKWHRETIDAKAWKVFADVEVTAGADPVWREDKAQSIEHGLGFVPAIWFTIGERSGPWDGTSIFAGLLSLFDDLSYTASQQARALYSNLDPQTILIGVPDVSVSELRKGGSNVWPLPVGADAKLLESDGAYITSASTRLDALRKWALDAAAVVVNDPERISGGQSGSALELLSAPMSARLSDLREDIGDCAFVPLLEQMLRVQSPGADPVVMLHWGSLTPTTADDAKTAVQAAAQAVDAGLMSRAAASRYIAPYLGVTDVEQDADAIDEEAGNAPRPRAPMNPPKQMKRRSKP